PTERHGEVIANAGAVLGRILSGQVCFVMPYVDSREPDDLVTRVHQTQAKVFFFAAPTPRRCLVSANRTDSGQSKHVPATNEHGSGMGVFSRCRIGAIWGENVKGHGGDLRVALQVIKRNGNLVPLKKPRVVVQAYEVILAP